jgi:hypothetical protein
MSEIKTVDELATERSELVTRNQEIDSLYAGQWIDPESEHGQEFDRNDKRIGELDKAMRQQEARAARLAAYGAKSDDSADRDFEFIGSERGAHFQTQRSGVARGEDIFDLSTVRSSVTDPFQQGKEMRERALRAVEAAHISEVDHFDDAARSKGRIEGPAQEDRLGGRPVRPVPARGRLPVVQAGVREVPVDRRRVDDGPAGAGGLDGRPDGFPRAEPDRSERRLRRPVRARHDDPEHQQRCRESDPPTRAGQADDGR